MTSKHGQGYYFKKKKYIVRKMKKPVLCQLTFFKIKAHGQ